MGVTRVGFWGYGSSHEVIHFAPMPNLSLMNLGLETTPNAITVRIGGSGTCTPPSATSPTPGGGFLPLPTLDPPKHGGAEDRADAMSAVRSRSMTDVLFAVLLGLLTNATWEVFQHFADKRRKK